MICIAIKHQEVSRTPCCRGRSTLVIRATAHAHTHIYKYIYLYACTRTRCDHRGDEGVELVDVCPLSWLMMRSCSSTLDASSCTVVSILDMRSSNEVNVVSVALTRFSAATAWMFTLDVIDMDPS
jgi:hypothetical protein